MLTGVQETVEGFIFARNAGVIYRDTRANFAADYGQEMPSLPAGVTERVYEPGYRHTLANASGVVDGGDLPWAFGDAAIAAVDDLLTAQAARVQAAADAAEAARPKTVDDVMTERARRLALGFDYDFGDARGVHHIGTTDSDMRGWDEVTQLAAAMLASGQAGTIDVVTNTGPTAVTPQEWQSVLLAAGVFRQPIWAASFVLQATNPIPADYADDSHWPANTAAP